MTQALVAFRDGNSRAGTAGQSERAQGPLAGTSEGFPPYQLEAPARVPLAERPSLALRAGVGSPGLAARVGCPKLALGFKISPSFEALVVGVVGAVSEVVAAGQPFEVFERQLAYAHRRLLG
jgi:hypothetical protein